MKKILVFLITILVFPCLFLNIYASSLELSPLDDDIIERVNNNINIRTTKIQVSSQAIQCFDVNERGMIALGFSGIVCIYDENFEFCYSHEFEIDGSYYVQWVGDDLAIYRVRSSIYLIINSDSEIIEYYDVPDTLENNEYLRNNVYSNSRKIDGNVFVIRDAGLTYFSPGCSQFVKVDADGNQTVLYDVSFALSILVVVFLILLLTMIIGLIFLFIKRAKESNTIFR